MGRLAYHGTTRARPTGKPKRIRKRATKRRPDARLAAFVKARDRTCIAPGCRRPARRCDIDHNLDWVKGGETECCNLCLLCKLCRGRHNLHYAEHRIMPRSALKLLWCKGSPVRDAA
jgi:hypothetical protein